MDAEIQKVNTLPPGERQLDIRVLGVEVSFEEMEVGEAVVPNTKNIVLESCPHGGPQWEGGKGFLLPVAQEKVGEGAAERLAHGYAVDLQPTVTVEIERVGGEQQTEDA